MAGKKSEQSDAAKAVSIIAFILSTMLTLCQLGSCNPRTQDTTSFNYYLTYAWNWSSLTPATTPPKAAALTQTANMRAYESTGTAMWVTERAKTMTRTPDRTATALYCDMGSLQPDGRPCYVWTLAPTRTPTPSKSG